MPPQPRAERQRFNRACRLVNRGQFDVVFQRGRKAVNRQLVAWIREAPGSRSRLGLSVSRQLGGAPQRNRVKRCLRVAFRQLAAELPRPLEVVIIARPMAAPRSLADAHQALSHLLRVYERKHKAQAPEAPAP